jgi:MATE family multidrug resistance protein
MRRHLHPFLPETLALRPLARMALLGGPIGVQWQLEYGVFAVVALMMGWLGTAAMAGHQIAINLASLTFMVPLGVSAAAAVLVGQAVGRGDAGEARGAARAALWCGVGFMAVSAVVLLAIPEALARMYTRDAGVLAVAGVLIPIAGVFQVFDGTQVVGSGILRGIGDTRAPMVVNLLGFWLIGLPVSLWLGFRTPLGPAGLWWGLVAGLAAVAVFLLLRIRTRMRRELARVVIDVAA